MSTRSACLRVSIAGLLCALRSEYVVGTVHDPYVENKAD